MIDVTCALIIKEGKVLLTQNGPESDHAFQWEFPGGKIKPGESAEACIKREILEELELQITTEYSLIPVEYDYQIKKIWLIPFICTIENGNLSLNEHLAEKWVNVADLENEDLPEADRRVIQIPQNKVLLKKYIREQMDNPR